MDQHPNMEKINFKRIKTPTSPHGSRGKKLNRLVTHSLPTGVAPQEED